MSRFMTAGHTSEKRAMRAGELGGGGGGMVNEKNIPTV
jgi:hypothetical protein